MSLTLPCESESVGKETAFYLYDYAFRKNTAQPKPTKERLALGLNGKHGQRQRGRSYS